MCQSLSQNGLRREALVSAQFQVSRRRRLKANFWRRISRTRDVRPEKKIWATGFLKGTLRAVEYSCWHTLWLMRYGRGFVYFVSETKRFEYHKKEIAPLPFESDVFHEMHDCLCCTFETVRSKTNSKSCDIKCDPSGNMTRTRDP